jgi:hypothetical protein
VVAAFSLAVHNGGSVLEAVKIARMIDKPHDMKFPELLDLSGRNVEALETGVRDLAESVRGALLQMTDEHFVSQAMSDYPQAPHSDLVSIFFLFSYAYSLGFYPVHETHEDDKYLIIIYLSIKLKLPLSSPIALTLMCKTWYIDSVKFTIGVIHSEIALLLTSHSLPSLHMTNC